MGHEKRRKEEREERKKRYAYLDGTAGVERKNVIFGSPNPLAPELLGICLTWLNFGLIWEKWELPIPTAIATRLSCTIGSQVPGTVPAESRRRVPLRCNTLYLHDYSLTTKQVTSSNQVNHLIR
jgi:hypothetical protein